MGLAAEDPRSSPTSMRARAREQMLGAVESKLFGGLSRPFRIGRFTVLEQLGMGGMGVVYTAFDPHLERQIAIKVLRGDRFEGDADPARARMLREAQAMARLAHPNVISVYEVGEFDDQVYIAMEFVRGQDLRSWLDIEERETVAIVGMFIQAGRGLAAAHREGVVHRDFKPDNVLVGDDDRARVVDFGLAASSTGGWRREAREGGGTPGRFDASAPSRARLPAHDATGVAEQDAHSGSASSSSGLADWDSTRQGPRGSTDRGLLRRALERSQLTRDGAVVGTPNYMAPEQYAGEAADARADQFSFCIALYRAVYREHPFEGLGEATHLRAEVLAGRLRTPQRVASQPRRLWRVVQRGLSTRPEQRYPAMDDLLADLELIFGRRRRARVALVASCLVLLGVGASVGVWSARDGRGSPCEQLAQRASSTWSAAARERIRARLDLLGASEQFPAIDSVARAYLEQWTAVHRSRCDPKGEPSSSYALVSCLDGRLQEFQSLLSLAADLERDQVLHWGNAFEQLEPVPSCEDPTFLSNLPQPDPDPAVRREVQALRVAMSRAYALRRAGLYLRAVEWASALEPRIAQIGDSAIKAEWALFLGECAVHRGALAEGGSYLQSALEAAERSGHGRVKAAVMAAKLDLVSFHRSEDGRSLGSLFRALPPSVATPELRVKLHAGEAFAHLSRGQFEASVGAAKTGYDLAVAEGLDTRGIAARLAFALIMRGAYDQAQTYVREAIDELPAHHEASFIAHGVAGLLYGFRGDIQRAKGHFRQCARIEAGLEDRQPHFRGLAQSYMAYLSDEGQGDEVNLAIQREGLASLMSVWGESHPSTGRARYHLAIMLVRRGQFEAAQVELARVKEIFGASHGEDNAVMAQPETAMALVELHHGRVDTALKLSRRAVARLEADVHGHASEHARSYFTLARALKAKSDGQISNEARASAVRALSLLESLEPGFAEREQEIRRWLAGQHD